jgi:hypothetical protein
MAPTQSFHSDDILLFNLDSLNTVDRSFRSNQVACATSSSSSFYSTVKSLILTSGDSRGDYGLYWDSAVEDENVMYSAMSVKSSSTTSLSSIVSDMSDCDQDDLCTAMKLPISASSDVDDTAYTVFSFDNNFAPVSCRSFESLSNCRSERIEQVFISIGGFRIVQDFRGERAEFKVILILDSVEHIGWKDFADFNELAQACREFASCDESSSWTSFFQSQSRMTSRSDTIDLRESIVAWERVLEHKFWSWYYGHLSVKRLMEETGVLEIFLKNILFEIPRPTILTEFVA